MLGFLWVSGTIDGDNKHGKTVQQMLGCILKYLYPIYLPHVDFTNQM